MKHPWSRFWTFSGLCLLLLGLIPIISVIGDVSMDFGAAAQRASSASGIPWNSNLWNLLRLSRLEPSLLLLVLGSAVPLLAAALTICIFRDRSEWRTFAQRLHPFGLQSRSPATAMVSYVLLIAAIMVCLLAVFQIRELIGAGSYVRALSFSLPSVGFALLTAAFLDQGAVLEEGGWRGYATPLLQDGGITPLAAAVIVGVIWSLWHVPRDIVGGLPERLGLLEYSLLFLPAFTLGCVCASIIASYFMNRLGGSLIPAVMVHGLMNDAAGFSGQATIIQALTPNHQLTKALPFLVLALLLVYLSGSGLGRTKLSDR